MPEPTGRTFTEDELLTLLTDRVQRETADLKTQLSTLTAERDEAVKRVDVLEAEKAALTSERDKVTAEYETFKNDITEKAAVAERKDARIERVKSANDQLPDSFFTPERAQRWAEMAEEQFEALVADLTAAKSTETAAAPKRETAAFTGGDSPKAPTEGSALRGFLQLRHGNPATTS